MMEPMKVLLIEDNKTDAFVIRHRLEAAYPQSDIITAKSLREALSFIQNSMFLLILSDLNLTDSMGPRTIEAIRKIDKKTPILALTGFKTNLTEEEALKLGANEVISKLDISSRDFLDSIERCMAYRNNSNSDVVYI